MVDLRGLVRLGGDGTPRGERSFLDFQMQGAPSLGPSSALASLLNIGVDDERDDEGEGEGRSAAQLAAAPPSAQPQCGSLVVFTHTQDGKLVANPSVSLKQLKTGLIAAEVC